LFVGVREMRLLILGVLLLAADLSYGAQCTIVDYGDHYEASCSGADTAAPASLPAQQASSQAALAEHAALAESAVSQDAGVADDEGPPQLVAQEQEGDTREVALTRSETGRRHAAYWLATRPRY
jgi:hypothetical protein